MSLEQTELVSKRVYKDVIVTLALGSEQAALLNQQAKASASSENSTNSNAHNFAFGQYYLPSVIAKSQDPEVISKVKYNGMIASLINAEMIDGKIYLDMGVTDFLLHLSALNNAEAGEIAEQIGEGLPQGLITTARITDAEGRQVISLRNYDGLLGTIGGMFSPTENVEAFGIEHAFNPYAVIILELWEEIGIWNEQWCQLTGQWEYCIRRPQNNADLASNQEALLRIMQDFDIRISDIITRGTPLNAPLIIFDVSLPLTAAELAQLHHSNKNDELVSLIPFDQSVSMETHPWLKITKTTAALQSSYPQIFPQPEDGEFAINSLLGNDTPDSTTPESIEG